MKIFVKTLKGTHFEIEVKPEDTVPISLNFFSWLILFNCCLCSSWIIQYSDTHEIRVFMRLMLFMDCELGLFLGFFLVLWNLCFGELFGVNHLLYLMRIVGILCFNYINFVFFPLISYVILFLFFLVMVPLPKFYQFWSAIHFWCTVFALNWMYLFNSCICFVLFYFLKFLNFWLVRLFGSFGFVAETHTLLCIEKIA